MPPPGRLACLGLAGPGRRIADHLGARSTQPLIRDEHSLGSGQITQGCGRRPGRYARPVPRRITDHLARRVGDQAAHAPVRSTRSITIPCPWPPRSPAVMDDVRPARVAGRSAQIGLGGRGGSAGRVFAMCECWCGECSCGVQGQRRPAWARARLRALLRPPAGARLAVRWRPGGWRVPRWLPACPRAGWTSLK